MFAVAMASAAAGFAVAVYLVRVRGYVFTDEYYIWSIGVMTGTSPFQLKAPRAITNPVLTAADITDVRAGFVADPFLVREGNVWHLFFEVWDGDVERGVVAHASSHDGLRWAYDRIVLREPFHVSYPQVLAWRGEHYMIPESLRAVELRLYRATAFPRGWEFAGTLMKGVFVDPTVFEHDDRLWLFAQTSPRGHGRLGLYFADDVEGPWHEHPASPILTDDERHARPAGRVFRWDNRLFRVAQDCADFYGREVNAFEILELTPTAYRERKAEGNPVLGPSGSGWNSHGMHTFDGVTLDDGGWLAVVDGCAAKRVLRLR